MVVVCWHGECGEFLPDESLDFFVGESALTCFGQNVAEALADDVVANLATTLGGARGHDQAGATDRIEHMIVLQTSVRAGDCVGIDGQLAGELADAGYGFARPQRPAGHGKADLANDLFVDGNAVGGIDVEEHDVCTR